MNGYIEEINEDQYLVLDVTYENKELLTRYDDVFDGIMDKIKKLIMIGLNIQKTTWKLNLIQMIIYH